MIRTTNKSLYNGRIGNGQTTMYSNGDMNMNPAFREREQFEEGGAQVQDRNQIFKFNQKKQPGIALL